MATEQRHLGGRVTGTDAIEALFCCGTEGQCRHEVPGVQEGLVRGMVPKPTLFLPMIPPCMYT